MTPALMALLIGGGGLFLIVLIMALSGSGEGDAQLQKRLARASGAARPLATGKKDGLATSIRRQTKDSTIPVLDRLIKAALPNPDKLRSRLLKTGKNINVGEYLMVNGLTIVVAYVVFAFMVHWAKMPSLFMGIAIGLFLPHHTINKMGDRRVRKFLEMFPEAIDTICRGLRSGLPIVESIATVSAEMPDPIGIEFKRITDSVRLGKPLDESMWDVAKRLDAPEFRFFIIALSIQKETGGNLAETLGNLADLLRKRRQLKKKIKAMSSEARASAMIIGSLPFLMFTLLMFVNSDYVMTLFHTDGGRMLMGGGVFWLSLGVFVMKQMISFEI